MDVISKSYGLAEAWPDSASLLNCNQGCSACASVTKSTSDSVAELGEGPRGPIPLILDKKEEIK